MSERKKISELEEVSAIGGSESLLVAVNEGNKRTTIKSVKEYVGESYTQVFSDFVTGTVAIIQGASSSSESGTLDVVYLSTMKRFAARRNINGAISYFSEWNGRSNYQSDTLEVRTDRVFFNVSDATLYYYNQGLKVYSSNIYTTQKQFDAWLSQGLIDESRDYFILEEE